MILADTSVWADHLRRSEPLLSELIESGDLLMHPFVIGEIALGHMRNRAAILEALQNLPSAHIAEPEEVIALIEQRELVAVGIGYVDAHLLASTLTSWDCRLWTRDKRLAAAAGRLGIATAPVN